MARELRSDRISGTGADAMRSRKRSGWKWLLVAAGALALSVGVIFFFMAQDDGARTPKDREKLAQMKAAALAAGATGLNLKISSDGSILIDGQLAGRQFSARVPAGWNHQAVAYAHGYSIPGASTAIPGDPLRADGAGLLEYLHGRGFAIGESAFEKSGIDVESGATNTLRLKEFLERLGATRVYLYGSSMGGTITMALIEQHRHAFAGALAACGVVDGWTAQIGSMVDLRASYNYFTRGTRYALPGDQDLNHNALSPTPPWVFGFASRSYREMQARRMAKPVLALFAAAEKNPGGEEARMIRNIAEASGATAEAASFAKQLTMVGLGMDDFAATYGGSVYGNEGKMYRAASLSEDGNAELNKGIQRVHADSAAIARAAMWHQATGAFDAPLVTLHNRIDSLVPYSQEEALRATVERVGNQANLLQRTVPEAYQTIPSTSVKGIEHCGFTEVQLESAWRDLQGWVETGNKPN